MNLIAWSQNMTPETAKAAGAILVSKDQLFERADILTIHLVLSSRTRGLVMEAKVRGPPALRDATSKNKSLSGNCSRKKAGRYCWPAIAARCSTNKCVQQLAVFAT